jgi:anhydro-N-acetylmuramic acid kinase
MSRSGKVWDDGKWALGLMSGTSRDGVDAALLHTDGRWRVSPGPFLSLPYEASLRQRLAVVCGGNLESLAEVERDLTRWHAQAVRQLLSAHGISPSEVGIIGFHGHTIAHAPEDGRTRQIGDGALLADDTGIDVVVDFRSRDMAAGGEGAPFAPLYHLARAAELARPLAVLNIGGVANVTWIGAGDLTGRGEECLDGGQLLAFDTGPGNALLDDWVLAMTGQSYDLDGRLAASGRVHGEIVEAFLGNPYFTRPPPKSLDRDAFDLSPLAGLSAADGAATLTASTAAAVVRAQTQVQVPPRRWLVCGGGRRNPVLMDLLGERLAAPVAPVEAVGWDGDAIEAEAFAYLAVRALEGWPLSVPSTTGARAPTTGGQLCRTRRAADT